MPVARERFAREESPDVHASLQAMTRLMRPTINLVCLHGEPDASVVALDPGGMPQVDLTQAPATELTRELAQRVVAIGPFHGSALLCRPGDAAGLARSPAAAHASKSDLLRRNMPAGRD